MNELDNEKLLYERFWALLNDADLMRVFKRYGPMAFRRSSVLEGFEAFIKQNGMRGECCVEIGSLKGLTAIVLARYFKRVVSIDIVEDPLRREIVDFLEVKNVEFVIVKDNAEKALRTSALKFDGAYVDGDHARDTETDFALVRRSGQVLFHEHWGAQSAVVQLVARLQNVVTNGKFALWTA